MPKKSLEETVAMLLRREKALATFGTFAFRETSLQAVLDEAAVVCAVCLNVQFSKICRYRPEQGDLLVVAGHGWKAGVVGYAISMANESSPQGQAFTTGQPQLCPNIDEANTFVLPAFYPEHAILSTVDVLVAAKTGPPFGVLEIDSQIADAFEEHDIDFLTGFANVLAEAVVTTARADELRQTIVRMEQAIEEKETLSQELKHRVRNSLHLVYAMLTAELETDHDPASILAFRSIALRVMGLAQVFDHLLGVGMSRVINFGDYVTTLCGNLPDLYRKENITLACSVDGFEVGLDDATALGIIITELVNNAYLHAFPDDIGDISVTLRVTGDTAVLQVADTGISFQEVATTRRGMRLVRRLVQQVNAVLVHEPPPGTTWTLTLAATPPAAA